MSDEKDQDHRPSYERLQRERRSRLPDLGEPAERDYDLSARAFQPNEHATLARLMLDKNLDEQSKLQLYADVLGLRGVPDSVKRMQVPSFGVNYTRRFAGGGNTQMYPNKPSGPGFGGRGFGSPIPRNQLTAPSFSPSTPAPTGANGIAGAFQGVNPARAGYDVGTAAVMANQRPSQVPMQSVMSGWGSQDQAPAQYMRGMMDGLRGQPPVYGGSQQNYDPYAGGQGYNPFASYNQQNAQPIGFKKGGVVPPKPTNDPAANYAAAKANAQRAQDAINAAATRSLFSSGTIPADLLQSATGDTRGIAQMEGIIPFTPTARYDLSTEGFVGPTVNNPAAIMYGNLPGNMSNNPAIAQAIQNEATRNQAAANYNAMMNNPAFIDFKAKVASGDIVNTPYGYMSAEKATLQGMHPDQMAERDARTAALFAQQQQQMADFEARAAAARGDALQNTSFESGKNRETQATTPRPNPFSDLPPLRPHTSSFAPSATPAPAASAPPSVAATPSSEPQGPQGFNNFTGFQNFRDNLRKRLQTYQPRPAITPSRPQAGAFGGFGNAAGGGRSPVAGGILGGRR